MRVVALISGGKDSCFNMMQCVAAGHEIVALANLEPPLEDEMDSYMYQTVGHDGISLYSEAMGLPLYRRKIQGTAVVQKKEYSPVDGDEVEDLYCLLSDIKAELEFDAIAVGAILSDYQRIRVENVCTRLGCISLAYLWRRDQSELLQEMIDCGINAIIIKTASLGLDPDVHLGQTIAEMKSHLTKSKKKYGINVCGEGGEYETFTLDCPLFTQAIILDEFEKVIHSNDAFAPVGYLKLTKLHLVKKTAMRKVVPETEESASEDQDSPAIPIPVSQKKRMVGFPVKCPLDHLSDLVECHKADCCDGHIELCSQNHGPRETDDDEEYSDKSNCNNLDNHNRSISGSAIIHPIPLLTPEQEDLPRDSENGESDTIEVSELSSAIEESLPENVAGTESGLATQIRPESQRENLHFPVTRRIISNAGGWFWIMGIHDNELAFIPKSSKNRREDYVQPIKSPRGSMQKSLESLRSALEEHNLQFSDLVSIVMYVSNLSDYAEYNAEYLKIFSDSPPVRICVEAPLPSDLPVLIEALAFRSSNIEGEFTRKCMHVQGISHWAPANIGPYSQAIWVGDIIYIAGQIGLVPGSMKLVEGGARIECKLALRHISRIIKAVDSKVEMRDVVQGVCYVTDAKFIEECRREWEKRTNNAIVEYLVVPRLPRDATVEWQVWAHKHNTAFEYEETGCYIGADVKVRLIRRWNYECRVAVIVCTALICNPGGRFGRSEMIEMTEYALNKLNQKSDDKSQECAIRVYYRLGAVNPSDIDEVMGNQSAKYNVAFSIIPVCLLVKETAVISFCGVRHQ